MLTFLWKLWTSEVLSCARLFVISRTVAYKTHPSMAFFRQEYWSGLPFPSPGDIPDPGIKPRSPALQQMLYRLSHQGSYESCKEHNSLGLITEKNLIISWNRKENFHFLITLSCLTPVVGRAVQRCSQLLQGPSSLNLVPKPRGHKLTCCLCFTRLLFLTGYTEVYQRGAMRASRMLLEPGSSSGHKKGTVCVKSANVKAIQCHELLCTAQELCMKHFPWNHRKQSRTQASVLSPPLLDKQHRLVKSWTPSRG